MAEVNHANAEAILTKYDADASGVLELKEFGTLVADLRRYRAQSKIVIPSIATLERSLPAGERFELRVDGTSKSNIITEDINQKLNMN